MNFSSPSYRSPGESGPTRRELEALLMASVRREHPEWAGLPGGSSRLARYEQKLRRILGAFG